jgi:hypothetical protein
MNTTRIVVLATFVILGIYDAWVCSAGKTDASISQFIVDLVNISPVAYGVFCILLGHFGFPMVSKFKKIPPPS